MTTVSRYLLKVWFGSFAFFIFRDCGLDGLRIEIRDWRRGSTKVAALDTPSEDIGFKPGFAVFCGMGHGSKILTLHITE